MWNDQPSSQQSITARKALTSSYKVPTAEKTQYYAKKHDKFKLLLCDEQNECLDKCDCLWFDDKKEWLF